MQTSEKDIYACGDCVEFEGENAALWAEASEQGKVAGANAAGECVDSASMYQNFTRRLEAMCR